MLLSAVLSEPLLLSRELRTIVGRGPKADLRIKTEKVSRRHAQIYWDGRCFVVLDEGSTNGTLLNDRELKPGKQVPLLDGDRLGFGGYEVKVQVLARGEMPDVELGGPTQKMKRGS